MVYGLHVYNVTLVKDLVKQNIVKKVADVAIGKFFMPVKSWK